MNRLESNLANECRDSIHTQTLKELEINISELVNQNTWGDQRVNRMWSELWHQVYNQIIYSPRAKLPDYVWDRVVKQVQDQVD